MQSADYSDRFWERVDATGPCWEWTGARHNHGYGQFSVNSRSQLAHRLAWQLLVGVIPNGLVLDHLCRNRLCVNPDHLEPVTNGENIRRGAPTGRRPKACVHGHAFSPENTYYRADGSRSCKECNRTRSRLFAQARRQAARP